jgi:hypothetical protein
MALAAYELVFDEEDGEGAFFGGADGKSAACGAATEDDEIILVCREGGEGVGLGVDIIDGGGQDGGHLSWEIGRSMIFMPLLRSLC